ncbi:hypothetical protein [Saccharothrix violaceirubra]|uniref:hypothetical protein n=1 Tax=Saccharothrix violaceirubra TaxID=413306 RepID=UPI00160B948D|nr:hypothetical protein [Saccharothrix violaceirubra]
MAAIFHEDQRREHDARSGPARSRRVGGAAAWRRIPFTVHADPVFTGYTELQEVLRDGGHLDSGAGATLRALARRSLVVVWVDQVQVAPLGFVPRTLVELTRLGRSVARTGVGVPVEARRPSHLLSEWLWRSMLAVANAGDGGLPADSLAARARFYLGTGYRPQGRPSRGYIDLIVAEDLEAGHGLVAERRWVLTDSGRAHLAEHHSEYVSLYQATDSAVSKE